MVASSCIGQNWELGHNGLFRSESDRIGHFGSRFNWNWVESASFSPNQRELVRIRTNQKKKKKKRQIDTSDTGRRVGASPVRVRVRQPWSRTRAF